MMLRLIVFGGLVGSVFVGAVAPAEAFGARDILVVDADSGRNENGALFSIDPVTGDRTLLSMFGDPAQGPTGVDPVSVAVDGRSNILVIDRRAGLDGRGALFRVDPVTGARMLVSDFGDSRQGALGSRPTGIAVERAGTVLVVDPSAGRDQRGALFRVDAATGARQLLSDFGDGAQGPIGDDPSALAIDTIGNILVVDPSVGAGGAVFRVDARTGVRTVVTDLADGLQGAIGSSPAGLAIEASGAILVVDSSAGLALSGALFRVEPVSGRRTLLSDFGDVGQGPTAGSPAHVAVETSGAILITDATLGAAASVLRVDPVTGMRTILSDCDASAQGLAIDHPAGLTIVQGL
jgi:DNA-binding beta-propeller fold protein YncE